MKFATHDEKNNVAEKIPGWSDAAHTSTTALVAWFHMDYHQLAAGVAESLESIAASCSNEPQKRSRAPLSASGQIPAGIVAVAITALDHTLASSQQIYLAKC